MSYALRRNHRLLWCNLGGIIIIYHTCATRSPMLILVKLWLTPSFSVLAANSNGKSRLVRNRKVVNANAPEWLRNFEEITTVAIGLYCHSITWHSYTIVACISHKQKQILYEKHAGTRGSICWPNCGPSKVSITTPALWVVMQTLAKPNAQFYYLFFIWVMSTSNVIICHTKDYRSWFCSFENPNTYALFLMW